MFDENTDPNSLLGRPGQYIGKAAWSDERVASECFDGPSWDCGGDVEMFADTAALADRWEHLAEFADNPPVGGFYMWRTDTAIVRVGFALPPDAAREYEAALAELYGPVEAFA